MGLFTVAPVSGSVSVTQPAEAVFAYLSDPLNQAEWTPNFVALVEGPHDGPGKGTRYRGKLRGFGVVDFVIDEYDAGERVFRVATGPRLIPLTHRFAVTETEAGARIDHVVTCTPRGVIRYVAPLLGLSIRLMVADLNRQMRRVIDAGLDVTAPVAGGTTVLRTGTIVEVDGDEGTATAR